MDKSKLVLEKAYDSCKAKEPELTVIMIHGIASDSTTWNHALDYLEGTMSLKEVRFVTFDLLGNKMFFCYMEFFFARITAEFDNFHSVTQWVGNIRFDVCGSYEHHLAQIERKLNIVVSEG